MKIENVLAAFLILGSLAMGFLTANFLNTFIHH